MPSEGRFFRSCQSFGAGYSKLHLMKQLQWFAEKMPVYSSYARARCVGFPVFASQLEA